VLLVLLFAARLSAQGVAQGAAHPPPSAKTIKCHDRPIPQLEDVTEKAGIRFSHTSAPENRYIAESMSGGVLLLDYDRDGWTDIYFTNAPSVEMANKGERAAALSTITITTGLSLT
jgi:enediyne biosynthesis protein E4